jgi:hypothetical protein
MTAKELHRTLFSGYEVEDVEKALKPALKAVKDAKLSEFVDPESVADFNAVALPDIPYEVVAVTDQSKSPLTFRAQGQHVICDRLLKGPVKVEYVTKVEHSRWETALIAQVRKELEK